MTGLATAGASLAERAAPHAAQRRAVIEASPELQERGRTKFAEVADALSAALSQRGVNPTVAALLGEVGVAIFRSGFGRWVDAPASVDLATRLREAAAELAASVATGAATLA